MSLQLEVGKSYRRRDGEIVEITTEEPSNAYSFRGPHGSYTANGSFWVGDDPSQYDLVEEVTSTPPPLKLEIGKTYRTRDGKLRTIVNSTGDDRYPYQSNAGSYTEAGNLFESIESEADLVQEMPSAACTGSPTLQLEVGKTYLNREGERVRIIRDDGTGSQQFVSDGGDYYFADGSFTDQGADEMDLIAEVGEDDQISSASTSSSIHFAAGKLFRTRCGDIRRMREHLDGSFSLVGRSWRYSQGDGEVFGTMAHEDDIVQEVANDASSTQSRDEPGLRYDAGKPRVDLIPPEFIMALGDHYGIGAQKYAENNWRQGMSWSRCYACAQRHMLAFWAGEECDAETGTPHVIAAAWNMAALHWYGLKDVGTDDRPNLA